MATLLLTRADVQSVLDPIAIVPALREGFIEHSHRRDGRARRIHAPLPGPGTATVLFPGTIPGIPAYTVKVHAKFPAATPAIRGVLCLHSSLDGELLAVMDSAYLTAVRTGLTGALAAHELGRPDADTVAVLGGGVQGRQQLIALSRFRRLRQVWVYDVAPNVSERFAEEMSCKLAIPVEPAPTVRAAVSHAGIVLAATWSRAPIIEPGMLAPGTHVTTLGADEPGKAEVDAEVIRSSTFFCDDRNLAAEVGALAGAGLPKDVVAAELGEVLARSHPGRTSDRALTIFAGVGLVFQDAVCAWTAYLRAKERGIGTAIDFLA